jgi:hypothetical protein
MLLDEWDDVIGQVEDAHALLRSVYQNPAVPLSVRMKAASIAIEYERPTLKATAIIQGGDIAERLERAIERSQNGGKLIEAKPIEQHSPAELRPEATSANERAHFIPARRRV